MAVTNLTEARIRAMPLGSGIHRDAQVKGLMVICHKTMRDDEPLNSEWLWPSPTSKSGHITEPKEAGLPSPHEYRHHARTMFIQAGAPYAESALLLGQKLPGASGGYVHAEHLVEHLRQHAQALEKHVYSHYPVSGATLEEITGFSVVS